MFNKCWAKKWFISWYIEKELTKSLLEAIWIWGEDQISAKIKCCKLFFILQSISQTFIGLFCLYMYRAGWWWKSLRKVPLDISLAGWQVIGCFRVLGYYYRVWSRGAVITSAAFLSPPRHTESGTCLPIHCRALYTCDSGQRDVSANSGCHFQAQPWDAKTRTSNVPPLSQVMVQEGMLWWNLSQPGPLSDHNKQTHAACVACVRNNLFYYIIPLGILEYLLQHYYCLSWFT